MSENGTRATSSTSVEPATAIDRYEVVRKSWGFPSFAKNFPRHPELDELVVAFARGDHHAVREGAPKLAAETTDPAVKIAAETLRARIEPDPTSKVLFLLAGVLLVFLAAWWVTHDGTHVGESMH